MGRLDALESVNQTPAPTSPPSIDYSLIAKQLSKPGTELYNASIKASKNNEILIEKKARNLIVVGLPNSKKQAIVDRKVDDLNMAKDLIHALNRHSAIKSTYRIKSKETGSDGNVCESDPLVLELESETARNEILFAAKDLSTIDEYKKVYIRPDRTPDQQAEFSKLNKSRKDANDDLETHGNLDKPFRFVIRSGKVLCINVKTTKLVNGRRVHPFVGEKVANQARAGPYSAEGRDQSE